MMLPYVHSSEPTMKSVLWLENTILLVKVFIAMEYLYHKWSCICPFVVISIRSCPHSGVIIGFVTRVTRQVALMKQELLTLLIFNILHLYNVVFSNHNTDFIVGSDECIYGSIIFNILHLYNVVFSNHNTDFIVGSDECTYSSIIFNILHLYNIVFSNHNTDFIVCSDEYPYGSIIFNILHLYNVVFSNHNTDFIVCSDECP
jgi:multisubunit Na+/H+ antiporter MnhF subunit